MTATWFVAQCSTPMMNTAKYFLQQFGFEHFDPFVDVSVGDGRTRSSRLFPSYIFVKFDIEEAGWQLINRLPGVVKLLPRMFEEPVPLPDDFMSKLRESIAAGVEAVEKLMKRYEAGDDVQLTGGAFEGHHAKVCGYTPSNTVLLEVVLFRRPMKIEALTCHVSAP